MEKEDDKLSTLLDVVIEQYLSKGDPVGSKLLHTLGVDYAPSTLRKYLNALEKEGLVYQAYNSSGRIPTIEGLKLYVDSLMGAIVPVTTYDFDLQKSRTGLRYIVETLSTYIDGVVTGYIAYDEYYFLGINKLLSGDDISQPQLLKHIIGFVEQKKIIEFLIAKPMKDQHIYHTFIDEGDQVISVLYTKLTVAGYEAVIAVIGPVRMNYKNNLLALKQFLSAYSHV